MLLLPAFSSQKNPSAVDDADISLQFLPARGRGTHARAGQAFANTFSQRVALGRSIGQARHCTVRQSVGKALDRTFLKAIDPTVARGKT